MSNIYKSNPFYLKSEEFSTYYFLYLIEFNNLFLELYTFYSCNKVELTKLFNMHSTSFYLNFIRSTSVNCFMYFHTVTLRIIYPFINQINITYSVQKQYFFKTISIMKMHNFILSQLMFYNIIYLYINIIAQRKMFKLII